MKAFYSKIERIGLTLQEQFGQFILFSLVKLKASPKKWDIVVCADGLPKRQKEAIRLIVDELKKTLSEDDFLHISGIVVLDKNEDFVKEVQSLTSAKQEKKYKSLTVSNLIIKEMRVLQINSNQEVNKVDKYTEALKQQIQVNDLEIYNTKLLEIMSKLVENVNVLVENINGVVTKEVDKSESQKLNMFDTNFYTGSFKQNQFETTPYTLH